MTWHTYNYGVFNDEDYNQNLVDEVNIVDIGRLVAMDEDSYFDSVNVQKGLSAPMDQALTRLHEIMVEITTECTTHASIELCDHATSFFSRSWIKHSLALFGPSHRIHVPGNGISLDGWWF